MTDQNTLETGSKRRTTTIQVELDSNLAGALMAILDKAQKVNPKVTYGNLLTDPICGLIDELFDESFQSLQITELGGLDILFGKRGESA